MSKFKVGDRVQVIRPYCSAQFGDVGVIKALIDEYYAVEFDRESKYFHDCLCLQNIIKRCLMELSRCAR